MLKLTSRFIFFRRVYQVAVQNRSLKTSPDLKILPLDKKHFVSKDYEYYINPELSKRLSSIPYRSLLQYGANTVSTDLIHHSNKDLADVMQRVLKVFDYNVKNNNILFTSICLLQWYSAYRFDIKDTKWNDWDSEEWKKAAVAAWCFELYVGFTLMHDDILDQSDSRRGQTCWYKMPGVGMSAILDGQLMQCGIYKLLQKYFGSSKCYNNLVQEFLEATDCVILGQSFDIAYNPSNIRPELFTFKRFNTLVYYKTTKSYIFLAIHLAMHIAGGCSENDFDFVAQLAPKIGMVIQLMDDYMDCYGDAKVTGCDVSDIQSGKLTWFAVKFFEESSDSDKVEFMDIYGINNEASISKLLSLYGRYSLKEKYFLALDQLASEILAIIEPKRSWLGGVYARVFSQMSALERF